MKGIGEGIRGELRNGKNIGFNKTRILSGNHAIEVVRKIVGNTVPLFAELGSIRGDFSIDSPTFLLKKDGLCKIWFMLRKQLRRRREKFFFGLEN